MPGAAPRRRRHRRPLPVHGGGAGARRFATARRVVRAIIDGAAGGVWPDMVFLIDVDPSVARGRRKVAKLLARDRGPRSRKGLAGSGLGQRLREGYLDARGARSRALGRRRQQRRRSGRAGDRDRADDLRRAPGQRRPLAHVRACAERRPPAAANDAAAIDDPRGGAGGVSAGSTDARAREPTLAAYVLSGLSGQGVDERRRRSPPRAAGHRPRPARAVRRRVLAAAALAAGGGAARDRAVAGRSGGRGAAAWSLRELLAEARRPRWPPACRGSTTRPPGRCATSCTQRVPDAVMASLALLDRRAPGTCASAGSPSAAGWRRRSPATPPRAPPRARSPAWTAARLGAAQGGPQAPRRCRRSARCRVWATTSLALARTHARAARPRPCWRRSPAWTTQRAWAMRLAMAPHCREALDSMIGLDHRSPGRSAKLPGHLAGGVIKSLGVLVNGARGAELLRRALAAVPAQHLAAQAGDRRRDRRQPETDRDGGLTVPIADLTADALGLGSLGPGGASR